MADREENEHDNGWVTQSRREGEGVVVGAVVVPVVAEEPLGVELSSSI